MNTSWTHNSRRALRPLLLLLGVAAAVISGLILIAARGQAASQSGGSTQLINGIACERDERLAFHIHAHVAIYANGDLQTVPYGIGIGKPWQVLQSTQGPFVLAGSCFYCLHTHTADGIIHVESPVQRSFTLGDFFAIWGQPLSRNQVANAVGPMIVYVDGERWSGDPNTIPLQAHELIQLDVGDDTPPQPFTFPPGA
jgi:hypothetical protein